MGVAASAGTAYADLNAMNHRQLCALGSAYMGNAAHLDECLLDLQADEVCGRGVAVERHVKEGCHSSSCRC